MKQSRIWWVYLAVLIAAAGVIVHVGAVIGGTSWFVFFNAPPSVVASARAGTWLAPVSSFTIAALMGLCGLYAASAAGLVRHMPMLRLGLACMATICVVRALLLPVLALSHPELRNTFEVVSALIWGTAGVGFAVGFAISRSGPNNSFKPNLLRKSA